MNLGGAWAVLLLLGPLQQAPEIGADVSAAMGKLLAGDSSGEATLRALTDQGRKDAASVYGELLLTIARTPEDARRGCEITAKGAEAFPSAKHNLARCYDAGMMGAADPGRAFKLYEEASTLGFLPAKCALGQMLIEGRGAAPNPSRGLELCTEAADGGDVDAQIDLAVIYLTGKVPPRDPGKAKALLERAVEKGNANAASILGQIYFNGDGVPKNAEAAAGYWRLAYQKGRKDVSKLLGDEAFQRATSIPSDAPAVAEAIKWYEAAIAAGADGPVRTEIDQRLAGLRQMQAGTPR